MEFSITALIVICIVISIISCIIKKCCTNENNININDDNSDILYVPNHNNLSNNTENNIPNPNVNVIRYYHRGYIYNGSENINENNILNLSKETYVNDINNNLSKLETYKYSQIEVLFDTNVKNDNISCPICFENYLDDDEIYNLKCSHVFHSKCLKDIALNKAICPLCRKNLFD